MNTSRYNCANCGLYTFKVNRDLLEITCGCKSKYKFAPVNIKDIKSVRITALSDSLLGLDLGCSTKIVRVTYNSHSSAQLGQSSLLQELKRSKAWKGQIKP